MSERRQIRVIGEAGDAPRLLIVRNVLAILAFIPAVVHYGWHEPWVDQGLLHGIQASFLGAFAISMAISAFRSGGPQARREFLKSHWAEVALVLVGAAVAWSWPWMAMATSALVVVATLRVYMRIVAARFPPGLLFASSFLVLIALGAIGLKLPAATPADQPISTVDAVFTITSAISQTGLVVRPTGEGFTRLGQLIILAWIQIGALGILVFGAVVATLLGSSFGVRATQSLSEPTDQGWTSQYSLGRLVVFIMIITHGLELIGAVTLYFTWPETWPGAPDMSTPLDRMYHCVFFAVSAFCNSGFSTAANSFQGLRTHWVVHTVIPTLILIGSIGFPVLDDMFRVAWGRLRGRRAHLGRLVRLNVNTKIVLCTTACLYLFGFGAIFLSETMQEGVPVMVAALDAHFMCFQRTTGFDTISPNDMGELSRLTLIFLMFVGGSPGSVAGGVKVMVFAVLALTVWATLTGRDETEAWGRRIPDHVVRRCATILALCLAAVMATAGALAVTEQTGGESRLAPLLFEAVSAFGTTGLSMGITSELSAPGRIALICAMFTGRVGALALLAALFSVRPKRRAQYTYPHGDVIIF